MTRTDLFPRVSAADWEALASRAGLVDLSTLTARSDDGLPVGPLYPTGDAPPIAGRTPGTRWIVAQRIDHGDADAIAATVRTAVAGGATGAVLVATDSTSAHGRGIAIDGETLKRIAHDGALDGLALRIDLGADSAATASGMIRAASAAGVDSLCLAFDPVATLAAQGALPGPGEEAIASLLVLGAAMHEAALDGEAMVADGRVWHDAGASEAQELGAMLATATLVFRIADETGHDRGALARRLGLILAVDADQFLSIAKLRAARQLFARLYALLGIEGVASRVHAETSFRMMSRRDPYLNMLRATGAAFAAAVGGAETLAVLPLAPDGDPFADRMARNIQSIALDEASLFRVGDPGAGSGAIEALTGELAEAAWNEFRAIEAEGGILAAIATGSLPDRIATMRDDRLGRVATRAIEIVGVNVHVDRGRPPATAGEQAPPADAGPSSRLRSVRLAEPFEHLCARSQDLAASGIPPVVFMARIDTSAGTDEAVAAAADALATGGLEAIEAGEPGDDHASDAAFAQSGAAVACIAAGRSASEDAIAGMAASLKDAGAALVLFHGSGKRPVIDLPVVDGTLAPGADLVAILGKTLDAIANAGKKMQNHAGDQKARGSES